MKNMPEKKFRAGAITLAIWKNQAPLKDGQLSEYKTISLERGYQDKDGLWKNTTHFRVNDLPKAALVLSKAYEYLTLTGQETIVGAL